MTENQDHHIYRVDKFVVPDEARAEFISDIRRTHNLLKDQPGFIQDFLLEQSDGPGEFNIVTFVEWESQEAIENARDEVKAMHERINFDPEETISRLSIKTDIATYTQIDS